MSDEKHVKISAIITLSDPSNPTITIVLEIAIEYEKNWSELV
jgi:hypothetical protein